MTLLRNILILILPFTFAAIIGHSSEKCEPALNTQDAFQVKVSTTIEETWAEVEKFLHWSLSKQASAHQGSLVLITSLISEESDLGPARLSQTLRDTNSYVVDAKVISIENALQNWMTSRPTENLVLMIDPTGRIDSNTLEQLIDRKSARISLVLISKIGHVFLPPIAKLENQLISPYVHSSLRLYLKTGNSRAVAKATTPSASTREVGSKPKVFAMDPTVVGKDGNNYQFSITPGRDRGNTSSLEWKLFRSWIKNAPLENFAEQYRGHQGFQYLIDQIRRVHKSKKLPGYWWNIFEKDELLKFVTTGVLYLDYSNLSTVWTDYELLSLLKGETLRVFQNHIREAMLKKIKTYLPSNSYQMLEKLSHADSAEFRERLYDFPDKDEFFAAMTAVQNKMEEDGVEWQLGFEPKVLALLHYWKAFRLSSADQIKYLGIQITDNSFGQEHYPNAYASKERWASTLAAMEKAIHSSTIEALPFLFAEGTYYRNFLKKLRYQYPSNHPVSKPWTKFFRPETLRRLSEATVIVFDPTQNEN